VEFIFSSSFCCSLQTVFEDMNKTVISFSSHTSAANSCISKRVSYTLRNSFTIIVMQFRTKWVLFWHREHQSDSECIECSTALVLCCYCMCTTVFVAQRWRDFCNLFEGQVEDWNMATLLRIDALGDVSEQNTVIGMCCVLFTGVFEKCWV